MCATWSRPRRWSPHQRWPSSGLLLRQRPMRAGSRRGSECGSLRSPSLHGVPEEEIYTRCDKRRFSKTTVFLWHKKTVAIEKLGHQLIGLAVFIVHTCLSRTQGNLGQVIAFLKLGHANQIIIGGGDNRKHNAVDRAALIALSQLLASFCFLSCLTKPCSILLRCCCYYYYKSIGAIKQELQLQFKDAYGDK